MDETVGPFQANFRVVDRLDWIEAHCQGQRVINLGCADTTRVEDIDSESHVHMRLSKVATSLVGIDLNDEGLRILEKRLPGDYICHDAERLTELDLTANVVVAGEVVEHVNNPGLMFAGCAHLLRPGGVLLLTTPNAFSLKFFLHNLRGRDVNSDFHSVLFSPKTLRTALHRHGFTVDEWAISTWTHGSTRSRVAGRLLSILTRWFPQLGDTLMVAARRH